MDGLATLGPLLARVPGEVLVLTGFPRPPRPWVETVSLDGGSWARAAATKRAVDRLRAPGFVALLVLVNEPGPRSIDVTLFGKRQTFSSGAFALASTTRSPIVPIAARWRGVKPELVVGDPIAVGEHSAMAAALARWLEDYLREGPPERTAGLTAGLLARLNG